MPDVCYIQGHGNHARISAVSSEKTKHIGDLVQMNKNKNQNAFKPRPFHSAAKARYTHHEETPEELEMWNPKKKTVAPPPMPKLETPQRPEPIPSSSSSQSSQSPLKETPKFDQKSFGSSHTCAAFDSVDLLTNSNFPPDVVSAAASIPLCDIDENSIKGDFHEITITEIYTPYRFWFTMPKNGTINLLTQLTKYYNEHNDEYILNPWHLIVGAACVVNYDTYWVRGEILDNQPDKLDLYKIYLIDWGLVVAVHLNEIKYLVKQFEKFPRQAIRGRLASVEPLTTKWSLKAVKNFRRLTKGVLCAQSLYYDNKANAYYLQLIDTSSDDDVNIADKMIEDGMAKHSEIRGVDTLGVRFPTFKMIETGYTVPIVD